MAYTSDPNTDEGTLRTLVYDISTKASPVLDVDYYFSDAQLTAILDLNADDLWAAAADCCRSLGARFAKEAIELGLGKRDIYINKTAKSKFYIALAKDYWARSGGDCTEYVDSFAYGVDRTGMDRSEYIGDS